MLPFFVRSIFPVVSLRVNITFSFLLSPFTRLFHLLFLLFPLLPLGQPSPFSLAHTHTMKRSRTSSFRFSLPPSSLSLFPLLFLSLSLSFLFSLSLSLLRSLIQCSPSLSIGSLLSRSLSFSPTSTHRAYVGLFRRDVGEDEGVGLAIRRLPQQRILGVLLTNALRPGMLTTLR